MSHRPTFAIVFLATLVCAATLATSAPASELRFVYLLSHEPAGDLVATLTDPLTAETTRVLVGADATLTLPAGERSLELVDPRSGLVLLSLASVPSREAPADGVVRLPLPVRLAGRLAGFGNDPAAVEVHCGFGRRIAVSDFERREQGLAFLPFAEENQAWGLELPTLAAQWRRLRPRADFSFHSGWIAITAPPQLAVADRDGQVATVELALPAGLVHHATLAAGTVTPQPSAAVEVDRSALPTTDLPLVLLASLEAATVPPGSETAAALRLALLHRLDPRAAQFALRRRQVDLGLDGPTRIAGLPPFDRLDLVIAGPTPGIALSRSLAAPAGGVVRIAPEARELLGEPRRIVLRGRVRFADGEPIAGATVVYGSYPDRRETRTDGEGRFAIAGVAAGRAAVVFVDAPVGGPPPFDRATVTRRLEIAAAADDLEIEIEVPRPIAATQVDIVRCPGGQALDVTNPIPYDFKICRNRYIQSTQLAFCPLLMALRRVNGVNVVTPVEVGEIQVNPSGAEARARLRVPAVGAYIFVLSYTPFVYSQVALEITTLDPVDLRFEPPIPSSTEVIVVVDEIARPAPDVEVGFSNLVEAADPFDGLTDQFGTITIDCFTVDPVSGFVDSDRGCFEGAVRLRENEARIVLHRCDGF